MGTSLTNIIINTIDHTSPYGSDSSVTSGVPARHPKRRRMIDGVYDDIGQRGMTCGGYGDREHDRDDVDDGVREGASVKDDGDIFDEPDESEAGSQFLSVRSP